MPRLKLGILISDRVELYKMSTKGMRCILDVCRFPFPLSCRSLPLPLVQLGGVGEGSA